MNFEMMIGPGIYLILLVIIGILYVIHCRKKGIADIGVILRKDNTKPGKKKSSKNEEAEVISVRNFITGGDRINAVFMGTSAQFAEVGLWVLVIIPGLIYAYGAGKGWIAVGLFLGTVFSFTALPYRLMRFVNKNNNIYSLSEYFEERFQTKSVILRETTAFLVVFLTFSFSTTVLAGIGKYIENVTGVDRKLVIGITICIVTLYVVLMGLRGMVLYNTVQNLIFVIGITAILVYIFHKMTPGEIVRNIMNSRVVGGASVYLNAIYLGKEYISWNEIVSQLSFGLCLIGIPQIISKFFSYDKGKEVNTGRRSAMSMSLFLLVVACVFGAISRAFLYPDVLSTKDENYFNVFLKVINKFAIEKAGSYVLYGAFLVCILAALMAFLDSQMMTIATTFYFDVLKKWVFKRSEIMSDLLSVKLVIVIFAVLMYITSAAVDISSVRIAEFIWILMGCTFGPTLFLSLYWERMSHRAAVLGMLSGFGSVFVWNLLRIFEDSVTGESITLRELTGINAIIPAFLISMLVIFISSLFTKQISKEVKKEFKDVKYRNV